MCTKVFLLLPLFGKPPLLSHRVVGHVQKGVDEAMGIESNAWSGFFSKRIIDLLQMLRRICEAALLERPRSLQRR